MFKISTPARVCLFGEHQDYLGLTVLPAAISLFSNFHLENSSEPHLIIHAKDINQSITFSEEADLSLAHDQLDYFRAALKAMIDQNHISFPLIGAHLTLESDIPLSSGLSSSASILVGFIKSLSLLNDLSLSPRTIAELAYIAEHHIMGIPCGKMDHFACSFQGIFALDCFSFELSSFDSSLFKGTKLVIGDSGIPKQTANTHSLRVQEALQASNLLHSLSPSFNLASFSLKEYNSLAPKIPDLIKKRMKAILGIRDSTKRALSYLRSKDWTMNVDFALIGQEIFYQHKLLRDYYEVSHPQLDKQVGAAKRAGAYGSKLTGGGFGGSTVSLVDEKKAKEVAEAIEKVGGKAFIVEIV
ncbi:MAG: GHMP family kinase ATP-binding protein [Candidatus Kariarchaeaceae archaeon]